jgi:hypothetical protein
VTKVLAQMLESDVFSRYTNAMQTQIDNTLPDEMRWLAMHPRVAFNGGSVLSKRFALLCNTETIARQWLNEHALTDLEEAAMSWWTDGLMLVLTVNRGMLTIRMAGQPLEQAQLRLVGQLFARLSFRLREVARQQS